MLPQALQHVHCTMCAMCFAHYVYLVKVETTHLMRAHVHQGRDAHVLAIVLIATSINDMNEHNRHVTPNNYSLVCHLHSGEHKARA